MPYRPPGTYATFVQKAGAINNPGTTRVLALIGTGTTSVTRANVAMTRTTGAALDLLPHENVTSVASITSDPVYPGVTPTTTYTQYHPVNNPTGNFEVIEGKYISWKFDPADKPTVSKTTLTANSEFGTKVTLVTPVDPANEHKVISEDWIIEVTQIGDAGVGQYSIVRASDNLFVGTFACGSTPNTAAIPGISFTIQDTIDDPSAPNDTTTLNVGDQVKITTTAGVVTDPAPGSTYYVTYTYSKNEASYEPQVFFTLDDIFTEYGHYNVLENGTVINSLSLGAELAILNGAGLIVCVQAKDSTAGAHTEAIDKLRKNIEGISNINVIVPLTTNDTVVTHVLNHCNFMSSPLNGKERRAFVGASSTLTVAQMATKAKSFNDERVSYVVPGTVYKDVKDLTTGRIMTRKLDGAYLAAAVAGMVFRGDVAEPITNKTVAGFARLGTNHLESEMNLMAESGALVVKQRSNLLVVRQGITTATLDVNQAEITIVQIKDYVIEAARGALGDQYIGRKLLPSIVNDIASTADGLLNSFVAQQIILSHSGATVKKNAIDPRQVDVKFEIEAVYPLNYISIEFSFKGVN